MTPDCLADDAYDDLRATLERAAQETHRLWDLALAEGAEFDDVNRLLETGQAVHRALIALAAADA